MACMFPFFVDGVPVPCGKCPSCVKRRINAWSFRLMHEESVSSSVHWITLTYANENLPISGNNFATLCKRDIQLFFKRLRKAHPKGHPRIKYFLCGEYGSQYERPHYHVIVFNAVEDLFADAWTVEEDGIRVPIGNVYIDPRPLNSAAISYTMGYMNKKKLFLSIGMMIVFLSFL